MNSVVYFAIDDAGLIKIGSTANLPKRLRSVGNGRVAPMTLIGSVPGDHRHEHALQKAAKPYRVKGDWFHFCPAVKSLIQEVLDKGFAGAGIAVPDAPSIDDPLIETVRTHALALVETEQRDLKSKMDAYAAAAARIGCSSAWLRRFVNRYPETTLDYVTGVRILRLGVN